jgi:hypothetical protein
MIISPRAKSEMNYRQNSSQLRCEMDSMLSQSWLALVREVLPNRGSFFTQIDCFVPRIIIPVR